MRDWWPALPRPPASKAMTARRAAGFLLSVRAIAHGPQGPGKVRRKGRPTRVRLSSFLPSTVQRDLHAAILLPALGIVLSVGAGIGGDRLRLPPTLGRQAHLHAL